MSDTNRELNGTDGRERQLIAEANEGELARLPKRPLLQFESIENVGSLGLSKYSWSCGGGFGR